MLREFDPGDYLIFQIESGYGLLRVLAVEGPEEDPVWHVAAYSDLFLDAEMADAAIENNSLTLSQPHLALTNRAFESTQVSKMGNRPLTDDEISPYREWAQDPAAQPSDRSVRLLMGLR